MAIPLDVKLDLQQQVPRQMRRDLQRVATESFKKVKREMIQEFLANPITQEILAGPEGSNISGTLGSVSNLFAFIGFERGEQPISPILTLLEGVTLEYRKPTKSLGMGIIFEVTLPTAEDIFAVTPLPWASGRSWAEGIERGLSGLGYLLRKNKGRSGAAIQSRVKVRGGRFHNTPYISAFIRKYKKRFEDLQ
jgi:hypothetical protein|tara:strand:- start:904 stop:1482 length:579 start_codon:yes stop_codon:yes gene_type:complete